MRICHVCSGHSADDGRVFHRACVTLAAAGYDVHLIARSNVAEPVQRRGVTIHPLPEPRSRAERMARRYRVAKIAQALKPDLYHVHEPELLGPALAVAGSTPVVWDVHESYLDVLMARDWIPRPLRRVARWGWDRRERQLLVRCAGVVVVTDRIAERYRELHDLVYVIGNYPAADVEAIARRPEGHRAVFAGGLSRDRGLIEVVRALAMLKGRGLEVGLDLAGPPESQAFLRHLLGESERLGVASLVQYHGVLEREQVATLYSRASIGLVPYLPVANSMMGTPNKLLECMAAGLPVVFSHFPGYLEIAGVCRAGIPVDPTKPESIAEAVATLVRDSRLAREMGESGRRAVRERFNWDVESRKLLDLYARLLGPVERSSIRGAGLR